MKKFSSRLGALLAALTFAAMLPSEAALSQVVMTLPVTVPSGGSVTDLGNGPMELRVLQGSSLLTTSQGTGIATTTSSATGLTLLATPVTVPCVGCIISGSGITSGTTVSAFASGSNLLTLSAAMTVATGTTLAWGAACPTSITSGVVPLQAAVGPDLPLYTQARICSQSPNGPGSTLLPFAIGAH